VTDTERDTVFDPINKPGVSNLLSIYSLATGMSAKESEAHFAGKGYGDLKGEVAEAVVSVFAPIRERTHELLSDPAELDRLLASGAERAQEIAQTTLSRVYDAVGFLKASH
jgi:tryptophanyl-tRNA synthetase